MSTGKTGPIQWTDTLQHDTRRSSLSTLPIRCRGSDLSGHTDLGTFLPDDSDWICRDEIVAETLDAHDEEERNSDQLHEAHVGSNESRDAWFMAGRCCSFSRLSNCHTRSTCCRVERARKQSEARANCSEGKLQLLSGSHGKEWQDQTLEATT